MALRGVGGQLYKGLVYSLLCACVRFAAGRPVLVGVGITPRPTCARFSTAGARPIPLLLHRAEATRMALCLRRKGYAAIPAALYDKGG
ncbi:putative SsrA-binding protein [Candidatus Tremblaya princeps PCIT]|uniref:Putative SsrA-binding protein n=1 Tax=Tremblaya princeps (strain PCIT) TaxID=891398 RepID=F7XYG0_TREPP|nr:putative SsrA-binding protein [Candidatus Tremblaya princeps PCIT]